MKLSDLLGEESKPAAPQGGKLSQLIESDPPEESKANRLPPGFEDVERVRDEVTTSLGKQASTAAPGVKEAMSVLNKPTNFVTGRIADLLGGEAQQALNPENAWFPDVAYHDVVNYYSWSPEDVQSKVLAKGYSPQMADIISQAYRFGRLGVGLAADFFADPLMVVKAGQLTKASEAAQKAGTATKLERNILQIDVPFTNKTVAALPAKPVVEGAKAAAAKTKSAIRSIPGGSAAVDAGEAAASRVTQVADDLLQAFNYRTGVLEIDRAASTHSGLKRGDQQFLYERFYTPLAAKRFTTSENSILARAIEETPNLAPALPESVLSAAPNLGKDLGTVERALRTNLQTQASKLGVSVPESRIDDMVEAALMVKRENALDLVERGRAGLVDANDLGTKVIEGYLVHKKSPIAERLALKNPKKAAAAEEAILAREASKITQGNYLSSFDTGKIGRKIKTPLEEANQIMKEKTGITDYFITDPIIATAMKRAETRKLVRDKELLDVVEKYGVRPTNPLEKRKLLNAGYEAIKHPNFEGKIVKTAAGNAKLKDMLFPKNIAQKMGYYMVPREVGTFPAFMDSYNRVFRNTALFKADYHIENVMENMLKNYVQGVKIEDYVDTLKVFSGKQNSRIRIGSETMSAADVSELVKKWGIQTGGQFREGVEQAIFAAKKLNSETSVLKRGAQMSKGAIGGVFVGVRNAGSKAENTTRVALFLNRLKQGYTPAAATFEVEKFLFDFSRTTQAMDFARRFYNPFIQAAIKTAQITPMMIGRAPKVYNLYENNLMDAIESSIHDPVTAGAIRELYPEYYRIQDRIAGPLLPGNHWLAAMAGAKSDQPLPVAVALGLPGGLGILDQFMLWDRQVLKQNVGGAPLLRSFAIGAFGVDPFTGKEIDLIKGSPDVARRLNAAVRTFVSGAIALPNVKKSLEQNLGLGNPEWFTSEAVMALHANFGKFGRLTNLDREYFFRMTALASAKKALTTTLYRTAAGEVQGRTADILYSDQPTLRKALNLFTKPLSSAEVYDRLTQEISRGQRAQVAGQFLQGEIKASDIAGMIKNIDMNAKALSRSYVTLVEQYFQAAKGMREDQLQQLQDQLEKDLDTAAE